MVSPIRSSVSLPVYAAPHPPLYRSAAMTDRIATVDYAGSANLRCAPSSSSVGGSCPTPSGRGSIESDIFALYSTVHQQRLSPALTKAFEASAAFRSRLTSLRGTESEACTYALFHLRQTGSLTDYLADYCWLALRATTISPPVLMRSFLTGLKFSLRCEVTLQRPETVGDAIALAVKLDKQHMVPAGAPLDSATWKPLGVVNPGTPEYTRTAAHQLFDKIPNSNAGVNSDAIAAMERGTDISAQESVEEVQSLPTCDQAALNPLDVVAPISFVATKCIAPFAHNVFSEMPGLGGVGSHRKMDDKDGGCHDLRVHSKLIDDGVMKNVTMEGFENIDVWNKERVIRRMSAAVSSKQYFEHEDTLSSFVSDACIQVCPKNPANFNVDNVRVAKIVGGDLHNCTVVRGMVLKTEAEGSIKRMEEAKIAVFVSVVDTFATETNGTVHIHSADQLENYSKTAETKIEELIKAVAYSGAKVNVSGAAVGEMALDFYERYKLMVLKISSKEIELARRLKKFSFKETGLDQYAIEKFAESFEMVPKTLAENVERNAMEIISFLYADHASGKTKVGIDLEDGTCKDVSALNVCDLHITKFFALKYAGDAACTVLRVDQIIMAKPAGGPSRRDQQTRMDEFTSLYLLAEMAKSLVFVAFEHMGIQDKGGTPNQLVQHVHHLEDNVDGGLTTSFKLIVQSWLVQRTRKTDLQTVGERISAIWGKESKLVYHMSAYHMSIWDKGVTSTLCILDYQKGIIDKGGTHSEYKLHLHKNGDFVSELHYHMGTSEHEWNNHFKKSDELQKSLGIWNLISRDQLEGIVKVELTLALVLGAINFVSPTGANHNVSLEVLDIQPTICRDFELVLLAIMTIIDVSIINCYRHAAADMPAPGEKFPLLSDDWLSNRSLILFDRQSVKAYTVIFKLNEWNYGKTAPLALQFMSLPLSAVQDVLLQFGAICSEPKHRTEREFVVGNWFPYSVRFPISGV